MYLFAMHAVDHLAQSLFMVQTGMDDYTNLEDTTVELRGHTDSVSRRCSVPSSLFVLPHNTARSTSAACFQ